MSDLDNLISFYENEGEEEPRLQENGPHFLEFLTASRYLERYLSPNCRVLDSCAGTGAYAFHLAGLGYRVTAGDLVAHNVAVMEEKRQSKPVLEEIYIGDALDLSRFRDASFDAVLCMGALYHLHAAGDRRRVVMESIRLLGENGLFACTYMNRYAVILNNTSGSLDNLDDILTFAKEGNEDIFYASTPEETEALMASCGLEQVCHVALDGMSNFLHGAAGLLDEQGFLRWRDYHLATCETPSLLGSSYHNLYIGRCRNA